MYVCDDLQKSEYDSDYHFVTEKIQGKIIGQRTEIQLFNMGKFNEKNWRNKGLNISASLK